MHYLNLFLRIATTLLMVGLTVMLAIGLWTTYMLASWTRDGRVLAQVVTSPPKSRAPSSRVPLTDNQLVHKGDVLFEIDPTRFQIAVAQAQAQWTPRASNRNSARRTPNAGRA